METRLQRSAVHEAGHAVAAEFVGLEVRLISIFPRTDADGRALAHCRFGSEPEGLAGAAVLLAGEVALELAEEGYPVPAMPETRPWHRRSISKGEADRGDGRAGDREAVEALALPAGAEGFARRTARGAPWRRTGAPSTASRTVSYGRES